jgi:HAD superfamily hydrolase (TIGR01509 family)
MLRAVLFDLDGTLVDTERESAEGVRRALLRAGRVMSQAEIEYVLGHSWLQIHERLGEGPGPLPPLPELMAAAAEEREEIMSREGVSVLPGARELVARLGATVPLAIVSGSSRREADFALRGAGLEGAFQVVLTAEDYAPGKPSPVGFLQAASRLGVDPAECLVIEDSTAGIAAGRAAGARVVGVRAANFAQHDQSAAHLVVDTLDEIDDELLRRLFANGPAESVGAAPSQR